MTLIAVCGHMGGKVSEESRSLRAGGGPGSCDSGLLCRPACVALYKMTNKPVMRIKLVITHRRLRRALACDKSL